MTNESFSPDSNRVTRRTVFRGAGVAAAAVGSAELLAACGGSGSSGGQWYSPVRRHADPRCHRRQRQGHPGRAQPGAERRHRALLPALRAAALLGRQLHRPAGGRRVGHALGRRQDLDDQAAPGRHLPQRQDRHPRGRPLHPQPGGRQVAHLRRRRAGADHRLQRHQEGRRQHGRHQAQDAVRRPAVPPRGVHLRHRAHRLRPEEPGRHRPVQVQVVHAGQEQRLHQVRRLLGRQGPRRRGPDPGLRRPERPGQRAAGRPDPHDGQPALQPDQHGQGPGRPDHRGRDRRLGAVHDARGPEAVLRRPRASGPAPDLRPPADDRQRAERQGHAGQRPVRAVRPRLQQRPAPARAGHRAGQVTAQGGRPVEPPGAAVHR